MPGDESGKIMPLGGREIHRLGPSLSHYLHKERKFTPNLAIGSRDYFDCLLSF